MVAAIAGAVMLAGCSSLDLGPEPDNFLGASRSGAQSLTDPNLHASTPVAPGDLPGGAAALPAMTLPAGGVLDSSSAPATTSQATQPASTRPTGSAEGEGVEQLSVQDAILDGLRSNTNLRIQRYSVPIARMGEESARAQFDPTVDFSLSGGRDQVSHVSTTTRPAIPPSTQPRVITHAGSKTTDSIDGSATVTEFLPTGTTITAGVTTTNSFYSEASSSLVPTATVTQSLLRGAGVDVNLATLRQAEVATRISQYALRGVAEDTVANIEEAYWNLAFAERSVAIVHNALDVAQQQLDSTDATIRVGRVAETERAAAVAQVATEREDLIAAESTANTARLTFLQLITPASQPFWDRRIKLTTFPFIPTGTQDSVENHVKVALRYRPDLNEAKLQLQNGDLQIVVTKNGLLPKLDLFLTLSKTTLSSSFGPSITELNGPGYSASVGVQGEWEPINRAALASYHAAQLTRDQLQQTFDNTAQTIELDVRNQYGVVASTRLQIDATRATREADQTSLDVEQAKFLQGRSTSLLVAQAQQTLLQAQLNEVQAVTNHLNALVELYRLEGSLLLRRGLAAPGATPVEGPVWH